MSFATVMFEVSCMVQEYASQQACNARCFVAIRCTCPFRPATWSCTALCCVLVCLAIGSAPASRHHSTELAQCQCVHNAHLVPSHSVNVLLAGDRDVDGYTGKITQSVEIRQATARPHTKVEIVQHIMHSGASIRGTLSHVSDPACVAHLVCGQPP